MTAKITDVKTLIAAGINPKTGLPIKMGKVGGCGSKDDVKHALRIIDEQDAINRGTWFNLPCNISSQFLERMLYYKGQLAFFYMKDLDEFYFMPYCLDGPIDFYQRPCRVHPVPMTAGPDDKGNKAQAELLSQIKLNCVYGVKQPDELKVEDLEKSCVILQDYTPQISQNIIPRQQINDGILDIEAECIPFMQTALLAGTGVRGVRVNDADQGESVKEGSTSMHEAALNGETMVPIVGNVEFQDLANGSITKAEDYMLAMQSLDNFRLSTYGLDNGGLFEKKAHELQSEADINGGPVGLVMQDATSIRQNFCNIVNSIWGLGIWYEPAQNVSGTDTDGDGVIYDRDDDASHTGVETDNNANEGGTEE